MKKKPFFAFIPVLNTLLLLKLIKKSYWNILWYILPFVISIISAFLLVGKAVSVQTRGYSSSDDLLGTAIGVLIVVLVASIASIASIVVTIIFYGNLFKAFGKNFAFAFVSLIPTVGSVALGVALLIISLDEKTQYIYSSSYGDSGHDNYNSYNTYTPNNFNQNQYNPNQFTQNQFNPNTYNPNANQYNQNQYNQNQYNQNQYNQTPYNVNPNSFNVNSGNNNFSQPSTWNQPDPWSQSATWDQEHQQNQH